MEPHGPSPWYLHLFGGIRRSAPSYAQGFGGLSFSHSSTAKSRGLLRRRIKERLRECAFFTVIGLGVLALAGGAKEAKAQENLKYEIIRIGKMISAPYKVYINNGGEIVSSYPHVLYKNGLMMDLSIIGDYTGVSGINDRGETLVMNPEYLNYKSFIYRPGEKIELDFLGYDINNEEPLIHPYSSFGSVVGEHYFFFDAGGNRRYKWDLEEIFHTQDLEAFLINDRRQIAGRADIVNTPVGQLVDCLVRFSLSLRMEPIHPFLPQPGEVIELEKDPNYPTRYQYVLQGINNKGQIVGCFGHFFITNPRTYACMWDENGKLKQLNTNPYNWAHAINDNGQIVGTTSYGEPGTPFAVLYQNGKKINLNDFLPEDSEFERLESALDINDKGQIVGYGETRNEPGSQCVFLMNPIPQPSADLYQDGKVDFKDLAEFASRWLMTEP